jgi:hypothetical protein
MVTKITKEKRPANIFFGETRMAVLSLLFNQKGSVYLRQIVRDTGMGLGPVQREMKQLLAAGIINRFSIGNQVHFRINREFPAYKELRNLIEKMVVSKTRFPVSKKRLAVFCRKHHIRKLSLFGSALGKEFNDQSDIDILVEFEKGKVPGFEIVNIETELMRLSGRKVDLRTPNDLSAYFREQVVREAQVQYEAR